MAAAPNASMGLLNLGRCGGFLPTPQPNWSPACGFLVSGRSVSVSPLRWGLVRKKGRVFDSRTAGAVASGDAGAGSSELRHIEKELTFSPTFTDYVKIMESVKLDRCKNLQGADLDVRSSRRRFTGDGDASVVRKGDRRSGAARNKSFERGKGNQRNRRNDRGRGVNLEKSGSQKNVTRFADKRKLDDVENIRGRQGKIEQYAQRRIIRGDRSEIGGNGQFASHEKAKDSRDSMVVHQSGTIPQGVHSSDSLKFDKPEIIHMQRGGNIKTGKFIRRDAEATDFDDRAAFKTFEVFTDVRNRPRILRMEMEERIQKLASLLNATDVNTPEWKFSKMIHDAKIKFSDHSILRIVQILGRFGNWKCVLEVVEWLQSRERFKSYKSRYIYTTVLDVLGKAKRPFEALNVFYTMQNQLSSYPDMAAYHCIAVTLGQAGLVKELFDVLNACVQQKQWEGAFWVLQQLKVKNIRPTNTTYGLVMEVMLACGKYSLVYEFFNKVEKSSIPGAPNYKVLINALWREGKIDEAVMAVEDMESRGVVGSASLYYDLARCLCSGGRCEEALLQVEKICKVAKKPLVVTYTGLIQTCIDNGSMENAKYIFNEMCNYCSPNNVTCNIMMKSYVEYGMFEDAKDLLQNILNGRIRGKVDPNQNAIADKFTFNTFMEACAEAKRWNDFEYAFRGMLSNGRHFDGRRHLRMVLDAYRNGKEQLLDDIWRYLCHHSRVPPGPIIMERFCLKLIQGDTTAAISCVSRFQEGKIRSVSSMLWLNLLNRNADRLKEENITKLVHELNNLVSSCSSSDCLYQSILSSCTTFLSGATSVEMAPFDQQMALHNS